MHVNVDNESANDSLRLLIQEEDSALYFVYSLWPKSNTPNLRYSQKQQYANDVTFCIIVNSPIIKL